MFACRLYVMKCHHCPWHVVCSHEDWGYRYLAASSAKTTIYSADEARRAFVDGSYLKLEASATKPYGWKSLLVNVLRVEYFQCFSIGWIWGMDNCRGSPVFRMISIPKQQEILQFRCKSTCQLPIESSWCSMRHRVFDKDSFRLMHGMTLGGLTRTNICFFNGETGYRHIEF